MQAERPGFQMSGERHVEPLPTLYTSDPASLAGNRLARPVWAQAVSNSNDGVPAFSHDVRPLDGDIVDQYERRTGPCSILKRVEGRTESGSLHLIAITNRLEFLAELRARATLMIKTLIAVFGLE